MQSSKPTLRINLKNLQHNFEELKKACPSSDVGAAVKADAYGLGVHKVAPILLNSGCKHFFVANCEEGIELRSIVGGDANIYVFQCLASFNTDLLRLTPHKKELISYFCQGLFAVFHTTPSTYYRIRNLYQC